MFLGFRHFRVGDGSPGSVSGVVFQDLNQNGTREAGEPGVARRAVQLVSNGQVMQSTMTNANGQMLFSPVGFDDCSVG